MIWTGHTGLVTEPGKMVSHNYYCQIYVLCHPKYDLFQKEKTTREKILITESLTSRSYHLLKGAQEKYGEKNVWTSHGRILFKQNSRILIYKSS